MHRFYIYGLIALSIALPSALLAAVLIEDDEDQIDAMLGQLERDGLGVFVDQGAFDDGGLEVSSGSQRRLFGEADQDGARALIEELTGVSPGASVDLRQQQVTLREDHATVILNVEVDDDSYVALRLTLSQSDDHGWRVQRLRVMS